MTTSVEHFYQNPQFGEDWFTYSKFYKQMVNHFSTNSIFVEVGSWKGKSSSFMAVEIFNSNKDITFYCIDTWEGGQEHSSEQKGKSLFNTFLTNVQPISHMIKPMRMKSLQAVDFFKDNSIDFCFIDASHDYQNVINDIKAWYPKIKKDGVIAGHDWSPFWPGVVQAVEEFFPNKNFETEYDWWYHYKSKEY